MGPGLQETTVDTRRDQCSGGGQVLCPKSWVPGPNGEEGGVLCAHVSPR